MNQLLILKQIGSMKRSILCALIAAMFAACTNDTTKDLAPKTPLPEKIFASIDDIGGDSRVHLTPQLKTVWDANDVILVVINGDAAFYQFNGEANTSSGEFVQIQAAGSSFPLYEKPFAMYSGSYGLASFQDGSPAPIFSIEAEQNYMKDSYDPLVSTMLGVAPAGDLNFTFQPICGFLNVKLTGTKAVKSISITSDEATLAGRFYTTVPASPNQYAWYEDQTNSITILCDSPVQLGSTPTNFYFIMAPGIYPTGMNMVVTFSDGTTFSKRSSNALNIYSGTIQPLKPIDTGASTPTPSGNGVIEITYNTPEAYLPTLSGTGAVSGSINLGDGYGANVNAYTYYEFADTKATHTVVFNSSGAIVADFSSCHGIVNVDFSNF